MHCYYSSKHYNSGLGDVRETSRQVSFCAHAILSSNDVFIVPDTHLDPRFISNGLVTGPPFIRFYAGVPLVSPEGFKLGTFCIIDTKPREEGLTLNGKQNIRELAEMVMDIMVNRKQEMERIMDEKTRLIACAAHDLLSPLTGIQLNLGLLMEDETLANKLDRHQRELMETSVQCSEIIERICVQAIESFRGNLSSRSKSFAEVEDGEDGKSGAKVEEGLVNIAHLVKNVDKVVGIYPKKVPLFIQVDGNVPASVISDDLKLFRSILNYLTNACKQTKSGSIRLRIYVRKATKAVDTSAELDLLPGTLVAPKADMLVVECEDTGPGVDLNKYSTLFTPHADVDSSQMNHSKMTNSGLGLYSVATEIASLGGEFGVFPREDLITSNPDHDAYTDSIGNDGNDPALNGSVFWFTVPLVLPAETAPPTVDAGKSTGLTLVQNKTADQVVTTKQRCPSKRLSESFDGDVDKDHQSAKKQTLSTDTESDNLPPIPKKKDAVPSSPKRHRHSKSLAGMPSNSKCNSSKALDSIIAGVAMKSGNAERAKCVLIIDDSLTIRKALSKGFSRLGFQVDEAENGLQGFKRLKNATYDLVILDFLMPVMDGIDVAKKFRAWEKLCRPWFHQVSWLL